MAEPFDAFRRRPGWDLSRLLPRWVVEHKTSGDRRCGDETAFVPAKQAIPVARDPVIGPVADTPRQQQEYSRPGPAGQAGKNEDHGVGFEICVAIDNGDVSLGAGDIDGETGRQRRPASTLDRDETEPCAGIALNHEPDPPATKYADPVEQDEPMGNVVEAPRHPSLAHPILHRQSVRRPTGSWSTLLAVMLRAQTVGRPGDALSGRCPSRTGDLAALSLRPLLVEYCEEPSVIADTLAGRVHVKWETGNRGVLS
jgi:hypothetical protein